MPDRRIAGGFFVLVTFINDFQIARYRLLHGDCHRFFLVRCHIECFAQFKEHFLVLGCVVNIVFAGKLCVTRTILLVDANRTPGQPFVFPERRRSSFC